MSDDTRTVIDLDDSDIQVRSASKREIEVRLLPWNKTIETSLGPEEFRKGSMADTVPDSLMLMGLEHEASIGIGQAGEPKLTRHAVGRSTQFWEGDDGPRAVFKVGRTQKGDELLALAEDKIIRNVSVEFAEVPGGTSTETRNGRRVRVHNRVRVTGASMTHRPAYGDQAAILAVRTQEDKVANETPAPEPTPEPPAPPVMDLEPYTRSIETAFTGLSERLQRIEEQSRSAIDIPAPTKKPALDLGQWTGMALKVLTGERLPQEQMRVMADLITSDNLGVVPEAHLSQLIGVIDARRPFLNTTTRINTPAAGMTLNVPVITTRPTAGVQVNEKDDITSTETSITSTGFDAVTIAGGGDISIQLLKRSDPSYLELYIRLLAEAISKNAESEALDALLNSGVTPGTGTLDPEALAIGEAWTNATAVGQTADHIWLSSAAWAKFIDAKADGTNMPLYSSIQASINVGGAASGTISGLTPVYVPALDATATDVIIGPSSGFAWAEDGAFRLEVDVPSKAGRDVALVVIDWYCPLYPDAFTTYAV